MNEQLSCAVLAAGVTSVEKVERKAAELMRMMRVKVPAGTLRKVCVCVCVACTRTIMYVMHACGCRFEGSD